MVTILISHTDSLMGCRVLVSHGYLNIARESVWVMLSH